jgi:hypothetical protein
LSKALSVGTNCKEPVIRFQAICFILALAHKIEGDALFARQEQELTDEMEKKSFGITLLFLEELK